ncbi:hypothetical protein IWX90DRAFT_433314 [Phyllosticta citrichinensis]|uniref:Nucleoporin NUP53 n=1 Tax=Phyllosticta citrichinensis TaxID=1130410 RepID=A0ABR1XU30_9PEZI
MNSFRGGMQVHAVPESERAFDAAGRQLPWGYEYAEYVFFYRIQSTCGMSQSSRRSSIGTLTDDFSDFSNDPSGPRRHVEERGPFGRSTRRRNFSRSKTTGTPARKEDQARVDNFKAIDDIFNHLKAPAAKTQDSVQQTAPTQSSAQTAAAPALPTSQSTVAAEPTEVILYGFGGDTQWAAIEFYERISEGIVYEDYERCPPTSKYNLTLSSSRAAAVQRKLTPAALKKKNTYCGGDHWIKVTFDSPEAADRACHYSPHIIHGHAVYAELYRGTGPANDEAIPASRVTLNGINASPSHSSTTIRGPSGGSPTASSETASSATATAGVPTARRRVPHRSSMNPIPPASTTVVADPPAMQHNTQANGQVEYPQLATAFEPPPLRIRGAKRAVLLPPEQALLPVGNWWQQTFGSWPIIGMFLSGGTEVIGNEVPRKEDGSFDWDNSSLYWRIWAWVDLILRTDFLGLGE